MAQGDVGSLPRQLPDVGECPGACRTHSLVSLFNSENLFALVTSSTARQKHRCFGFTYYCLRKENKLQIPVSLVDREQCICRSLKSFLARNTFSGLS